MSALHIAQRFALPIDAVTGTAGILATKGAGKSNAAVVMAEEMYDAGVPWVAIDPKGDWYGIRSSADGKGPGLPIVVFGGRHGDVPLEPTGGQFIAGLVLEQRLTCVIDVSQFTKADTTRFLLAFGEYLFRHADDDGAEPLHLFLEEAHEYLPQQVRGDQANLVGAWQRIVKQGRFKGLGCTLVSQRSSSLNKDVLELVDTLIVLRTIGPRSREAIKAWVKDQDVDEGLLASLPSLGDGEAWIWSPGALHILARVQFRRRRTFDSGATPKIGQTRRAPATLADVDLAAIKEQMAETIERVKADDPKELRKEIARLKRDLAQRPTEVETKIETVVERVEVPVLDQQAVEALRAASGALYLTRDVLDAAMKRFATPSVERVQERPTPVARARPQPAPVQRQRELRGEGVDLSPSETKILAALAQYPDGRTKTQLGILTGYKTSGGRFNNLLGALRSSGYITKGGDPIRITDAGLGALGDGWEPLPVGRDLARYWLDRLPPSESKILGALLDAWPDELPREELGALTGYEPTGGRFNNLLGKLRTLGLVEGWRASDDLT